MSATRPKVLLYGKDARTDALAEAVKRSEGTPELTVCAPMRIPGLVWKADSFMVASMTDLDAMVAAAKEAEPDVVVIGPEDPLSVGLADALGALGIPCVGPAQDLARIETSKSWARQLVAKHGIPGNPANRSFDTPDGLESFVAELGDVVVKPDGLTGGKGVKVVGDQLAGAEEALAYANEILAAGGRLVIEERLLGEEFSLMTMTDGSTVVHCPVAQDHKRAFEGDTGPNTGGMGSYSCVDHSMPFLDSADLAAAEAINERVIAALASETGRPYQGVLYGGFMAVADGVRLVEYNARFGDPEAMNVLPLLTTDFVELAVALAGGRLGSYEARFAPLATVCKYVVPAAYPGSSAGDDPIISIADETAGRNGVGSSNGAGDDSLASIDSRQDGTLRHYWAAADLGEDGRIRLTGSRGVAFVGIAESLVTAERLAEEGANSVAGVVRHRRDIGTSQLVAARVSHMNSLRSSRSR